jgi:uncharacterized membrane protein
VGASYTFTTIDVPGSDFTFASGINNADQIVGGFNDGISHEFLLSGSNFTTLDVPGSSFTEIRGINDVGRIVGNFGDGSGAHGFLAIPVPEPIPEPGTLGLLNTVSSACSATAGGAASGARSGSLTQ